MRCADFRRHLENLASGDLDDDARRELALHMIDCAECARLAEDEEFWLGAVRRALHHEAPADLRAAILADGAAPVHSGGRRGLWGAIARHVWQGMTWRVWARSVALAAAVYVAVTWYTGRDDAPAAFDRPGPVTVIASPAADGELVGDGTLYLTDRLF